MAQTHHVKTVINMSCIKQVQTGIDHVQFFPEKYVNKKTLRTHRNKVLTDVGKWNGSEQCMGRTFRSCVMSKLLELQPAYIFTFGGRDGTSCGNCELIDALSSVSSAYSWCNTKYLRHLCQCRLDLPCKKWPQHISRHEPSSQLSRSIKKFPEFLILASVMVVWVPSIMETVNP